MYTIDQIRAMSPADRAALDRAASKRILRNFFLLFAIKYAVIYGTVRLSRKLLKQIDENN